MSKHSALIITVPGDGHAHAIAWGLRQSSWEVDIVFLSDFPKMATLTIYDDKIVILQNDRQIDFDNYSSIWFRKFSDAQIPHETHPSDRVIARRFWEFSIRGILERLDLSDKFVINGYEGILLSENKVAQMAVARASALKVPKTIVSTTAVDIVNFIKQNRKDGKNTITKGLYLAMWDLGEDGLGVFETERVTSEEVSGNDMTLAPHIFQEEITKSYEVRLTVMGGSFFAAAIDSQLQEESSVDYRRTKSFDDLNCRHIHVPDDVRLGVLKFNSYFNLIFGTFDFIVDVHGHWYFLEVNPMGQFLWVEHVNHNIPLLDAAIKFMKSGNRNFDYDFGASERFNMQSWMLSDDFRDFSYGKRERELHVQIEKPAPNDSRLDQARSRSARPSETPYKYANTYRIYLSAGFARAPFGRLPCSPPLSFCLSFKRMPKQNKKFRCVD